jgi:nicotinic acid mononucleotide adenylyltransferase
MTELSLKSSNWIDADPWEARQPTYKYTADVMEHFVEELNRNKTAGESSYYKNMRHANLVA